MTAAKLADFLSSLEAEEVLLEQRRRDEEGRQVFALMEGADSPDRSTLLTYTGEEPQKHLAQIIPVVAASPPEISHSENDTNEDSNAIYEDY